MLYTLDEQCDKETYNNKVQEWSDESLLVVDFHAQWCGPCKQIAPALEVLANEGIGVLKVDVDEFEDIAQAEEISAMPTFLFYKQGKVVDKLLGANKEKLKELVAKYRS